MCFVLLLMALPAVAESPKRCPEQPTVVRLASEHAPALKNRFESMSHLPYEVEIRERGRESELRVGYRCARPEDQFDEPSSIALLGRITRLLMPEAKTFGIKSIRLDFSEK